MELPINTRMTGILAAPLLALALSAGSAHASLDDFHECVGVRMAMLDQGYRPVWDQLQWIETQRRIERECDKVVPGSRWIPGLPLRRSF